MHLIKKNGFGTSDRNWDVYLAADVQFASEFQFPLLDASRGFKNSVGDFSSPGDYGLSLDGYGFDVDNPADPSDDSLVQFSFDGFLVGETEQRFSTHVRTEQNIVITTH